MNRLIAMRKYCPKCKSSDIFLYLGGDLGILYKCKKCGYLGPLVLEKPSVKSKKQII